MFLSCIRHAGAVIAWAALAMLALHPVLAQAAHPFGVPEGGGAGASGTGWLSGWLGQAAIWQSHFYRQLTGALRAWQAEGGAGWTMIGLSFAYGVFHALGPGHGKAVISAYVLANRQTARNGAVLAMVSALVQALVAIVAVAVLAWLLNVTAATMNRATHWLETASYALIVALGLWLVWRKALRPVLRSWRGSRSGSRNAADAGHRHDGHDHGPHAHHPRHHHDHPHDDCGCGHAHVPDPRDVQGRPGLRRSIAAVFAVGLRPCSGALIVLVFALSQGFFAAGIASALAMGLGTGLTVAVLVGLAVVAREGATRLGAAMSAAWAARLRYAIEAAAAVAVLALGALLLGGQLVGVAAG